MQSQFKSKFESRPTTTTTICVSSKMKSMGFYSFPCIQMLLENLAMIISKIGVLSTLKRKLNTGKFLVSFIFLN